MSNKATADEIRIDPAADDRLYSQPPCEFCATETPCSCGDDLCACTCGRCSAPYPWELN